MYVEMISVAEIMDEIQQFATSDVFANSRMISWMVDNLWHSVLNVGKSVSRGKFVENIVIGREYMQSTSRQTGTMMQVDLFLWDFCISIYIWQFLNASFISCVFCRAIFEWIVVEK